jgi:uncharacterized damage-inducible protein DinB
MEFTIQRSCEILANTPQVLRALLADIDEAWVRNNEGADTFSPFDVVGHLIHGEKTDWKVRAEIILSAGDTATFESYDRFAQFEESRDKSLDELLDTFERLRSDNVRWLQSLRLNEEQLRRTGIHPDLGGVTLRQLLATWVVHDLTHIAQISRVMAKQYREEIGPWAKYFRVLDF